MAGPTHAVRRTLYITLAVLVAFLIGFGWQYLRARSATSQLADARRQLALAEDEATLGAAALEAQRGSYEIARQLASDLFTGLQRDLSGTTDSTRAAVQQMLSQRDAVITMLSRADPASGEILARFFLQYRTALHGPFAVQPIPAPRAPDTLPAAPDTTAVPGTV